MVDDISFLEYVVKALVEHPNDVKIKEFTKLSYSDAFKQMITILRKEYAFNGIAGKAPDWDALDREFTPRVAEAESKRDPEAFSAAIYDFTLQFHDGHVGVGADPNISALFRQRSGGHTRERFPALRLMLIAHIPVSTGRAQIGSPFSCGSAGR